MRTATESACAALEFDELPVTDGRRSFDDIIDSETHADRPKNREALLELHQLRGRAPDS